MNIFGNLSLNFNLLAAIIGVSEFLKSRDKNDKLKRFYPFYPILCSCIVALTVTEPFAWGMYFQNVLAYAGISSLAYNTIKQTILGTKGVNVFKTKNKLPAVLSDAVVANAKKKGTTKTK